MKIVTVIYHEEEGAWWAESPDAPSFFATGESREVVRKRVFEALPNVLDDELDYIEVDIGAPTVAMAATTAQEFAHGGWFVTTGCSS